MDKSKWEYKKLGEVAQYPKNRLESEFLDVGNYVGVENLLKDKAGRIDAISLPANTSTIEYMENDILIGNIRPYLKKIWLADRHGGASGDVVNIRVKENYRDRICPHFLYCVLSTDAFFDFDMAHSKGAKMPRGNKDEIVKYSIPIPPIADQQRIVAELDCLNEMIVLKQEQLKEFDKLAQSIFYDMFGDPVTNEKGWNVIELGTKCEVTSFKRVLIEDVVDSGVPFIRGTELMALSKATKGEKIEFTLFITAEHYAQVKAISGVPAVGDLLIPSINSEGNIWILDTDEPRYYKDGRVLWVHVNHDAYTSEALKFIMHILLKKTYSVMATGATFAELKLFVLRELNTILPPLALQQQFAEKIQAIEAQKELVKQSIAETQQLLDSRMDYYFD